MLDKFSTGALRVMSASRKEASRLHCRFIGTGHLLLGLVVADYQIANILRSVGMEEAMLRSELENLIEAGSEETDDGKYHLTVALCAAIQSAREAANRAGRDYVTPIDLLLAVTLLSKGNASAILGALGSSLEQVRRLFLERPRQLDERLAKIEGAGKDAPLEIDLLAKDPGYLIVAARRQDSSHPVWDVSVTVRRIQGEESESQEHPSQASKGSEDCGSTDSNGKLVVGPIFPGEWEVTAQTMGRSWFLSPPQRVKIPPAGEVAIELRVQVFEYELEVLDAETGKPCEGKLFMIEFDQGFPMGYETDDRGRLELCLGPGKYVLWEDLDIDPNSQGPLMKPRPEPKRYEFEWTAAGPVPSTLRVTPEPKE